MMRMINLKLSFHDIDIQCFNHHKKSYGKTEIFGGVLILAYWRSL